MRFLGQRQRRCRKINAFINVLNVPQRQLISQVSVQTKQKHNLMSVGYCFLSPHTALHRFGNFPFGFSIGITQTNFLQIHNKLGEKKLNAKKLNLSFIGRPGTAGFHHS